MYKVYERAAASVSCTFTKGFIVDIWLDRWALQFSENCFISRYSLHNQADQRPIVGGADKPVTCLFI